MALFPPGGMAAIIQKPPRRNYGRSRGQLAGGDIPVIPRLNGGVGDAG